MPSVQLQEMQAAVQEVPHLKQVRVQLTGSKFWQAVRYVRQQLSMRFQKEWYPNKDIPDYEDWIYVTSVEESDVNIDGAERKPTQVFESSVENAARNIARKTHRLSTREEIAKCKADRLAREAKCREISEISNSELAAHRETTKSTKALVQAAEAMATAATGGMANARVTELEATVLRQSAELKELMDTLRAQSAAKSPVPAPPPKAEEIAPGKPVPAAEPATTQPHKK